MVIVGLPYIISRVGVDIYISSIKPGTGLFWGGGELMNGLENSAFFLKSWVRGLDFLSTHTVAAYFLKPPYMIQLVAYNRILIFIKVVCYEECETVARE